jgi:hypothetical protein
MLTKKDHQHLRGLYNRLSRKHKDSADEYFMQRASESLDRIRDVAAGRNPSSMAVTQQDAVALSFMYNRLIHVFGESVQAPFMQRARESFGRLESRIWPGMIRRPNDMTGLLNDGLSTRR